MATKGKELVAAQKKEQRTILLIVISVVIFAFALYIVFTEHDLTALLVGLVIIFLVYALFRLSGRRTETGNVAPRALDSHASDDKPPVSTQAGAPPLPITINVNQAAAIPPPPQIMRRCAHCGTVYPESSLKCPSCGAAF
jgi:hypothetical protein